MEPRVSIVTIAVDELARMAAFYEATGLARHPIRVARLSCLQHPF